MATSTKPPPEHILLIGAGVFSLSTALALLSRPSLKDTLKRITILDAAPTLPNPSGSSVDASRIIRADYSNPLYARLAAEAQVYWRQQGPNEWGGQGRYHEPGFLLAADNEETAGYVRGSLGNVRALVEESALATGEKLKPISVLETPAAIRQASGHEGVSGVWGYINRNSGWADAEKCVAYALTRVQQLGGSRVTIRSNAGVSRLLLSPTDPLHCIGARLHGPTHEEIHADLVILAAGAWSPSLIDLQGRCVATGQVLTYTAISDGEEARLRDNPTVMNLSRGMFIIPPRGNELKVARHGFGYRNLVRLSKAQLLSGGEDEFVDVSVPRVDVEAPLEGRAACREALREMMPSFGDRVFKSTRLCWYCDTPEGDFLVDWHPRVRGLFVATGGSGHGFKFFPVLGEKVVDRILGVGEREGAKEKDGGWRWAWRWRGDEEREMGLQACDDGSRAGPRGMLLEEELAKGKGVGDVGRANL